MAKANYTCAGCGGSYSVVGRNRSDADRLAKYYEQSGRLCPNCYEKQRLAEQAAESQAALAVAAEMGLPTLQGTEKQVQWAVTLRKAVLDRVDMALKAVEAIGLEASQLRSEQAEDEAMTRAEAALADIDQQRRELAIFDAGDLLRILRTPQSAHTFGELLREQPQAHWWIDARGASIEALAIAMRQQVAERLAAKASPAVSAEVVAAVEEESLLKPAGEAVSQQIVEIRLFGNELQVILPERNEPFRLLMKENGFTWGGSSWIRKLGITTGNPIDRAAETAHRIIGAGFMSRVHDNEARTKAISGSFEAEIKRWVVRVSSGEFSGWCCLSWPRSDDLYTPAKRIMGSRYKDGRVYVPASSILEVADFAEKYGFALSEGAHKMLDSHREAIARGVVIAEPKKPAKAVVETSTVPSRLEVPANPKVDDELLDNH